MTGKKHSKKTIQRIMSSKGYKNRKTRKGIPFTKKQKEQMSETRLQKIKSGEIIIWNKGLTKEMNDILRKVGEKSSETLKKQFKNGRIIWNKNISGIRKMIWLKKCREGLNKSKPSSLEKAFMKVIKQKNLPYRYTGNFTFWINKGNPDFIHLKKKICIEVFEPYWKIRTFGSVKNYRRLRSKQFMAEGYKTLFFEHDEIFNNKEKIIEELVI